MKNNRDKLKPRMGALALVVLYCAFTNAFAGQEPAAKSDSSKAAPAKSGLVSRTDDDMAGDLPKHMEGIKITEKIGAQIPMDLKFLNERGVPMFLKEYLNNGKPTILTLNYSECPLLCSVQLEKFVETLADLEKLPGRDFNILTISINHQETPEKAKAWKKNWLSILDKPGAEWNFLVGSQKNIKILTDAVGFPFRWVEDKQFAAGGQYVHDSALIFLTPEGKVSRYLYAVKVEPKVLNLTLLEASQGQLNPTLGERIFLACYSYDPHSGTYVIQAKKIMYYSGILMVLAMLTFLGSFWIPYWRKLYKENRTRRSTSQGVLQNA